MRQAVETRQWAFLQDFYLTTFDSFQEINAVFKVSLLKPTHEIHVVTTRILYHGFS